MKKNIIFLLILTFITTSCGAITSDNGQTLRTTANDSPNSLLLLESTQKPSSKKIADDIKEVATNAPAIKAEIGDDLPVSRSLVAKMLALTYLDTSSINNSEREITFTDTDKTKWYDKYINSVYVEGLMLGYDNKFNPDGSLTLQQAQTLLDSINPDNKVKVKMNDDNKEKAVSYALWTNMYINMLNNLSKDSSIYEVFGIKSEDLIILATSGNNPKLYDGYMVTDKGMYYHAGLNMDSYIDKQINVFTKNNEIIAIVSVKDQSPTIKNAYVVKNTKNNITIFSGGVERTFSYINNLGDVSDTLCDVKISDNTVKDIELYDHIKTGIINKITQNSIEIKDENTFLLGDNFNVYSKIDNVVKIKNKSNLTVGTDIANIVFKDDKAVGAIITKSPIVENLRVAISTTDFISLLHENITLQSKGNMKITNGTDTKTYKSGEIFNLADEKSLVDKGRLYISSDDKIQITSIKRGWEDNESPYYRGTLEISKEDGGYALVNQLSIEEYLYAVVPSEMPSSFGVEVAKVQAVAARSYAYNQFFGGRFSKYGANVDDSVSCQVYNNIPENDVSIEAVDATKGKCIAYKGDILSANFFSTSSGMTANSGEVWVNSETNDFPSKSSDYLVSVAQFSGKDYGNLSKEDNALKFFKDTEIESFDSSFNWFRWNTSMTLAQITETVNKNLKDRYLANPLLIKTLQDNGVFRSRAIETVGNVKDIEVTKRSEAGNIIEMKITGDKKTILVETEYNVRALVRPTSYDDNNPVIMNKIDGTTSFNYFLMPSGFYAMEKNINPISNEIIIDFYGGGNGHGVGMSQNGVKGMTDKGYTFDEILEHYYVGSKLVDMN